jgi:hypothetical protein
VIDPSLDAVAKESLRTVESHLVDFRAKMEAAGREKDHVNSTQTVMRHSTMTLTMDTYGHLIPGQEADAVAALPPMMTDPSRMVAATGTDDLLGMPTSRATISVARVAAMGSRSPSTSR